MTKEETAWITNLLQSVQPPLGRQGIANILRRVRSMRANSKVIHHAEDDISSEVVRTINDALERVRAELNSLYAPRDLQQGEDVLYDAHNPAGEEWEPDEDADWYDYAPAGTMSQREVREGALAGIFDADRRDLIAKQNRLLLLKHIIVTRRIRQLNTQLR